MVAKFLDLNNLSWWKWRNDSRSERNLCNCVKKPEKNSGLQRGLGAGQLWVHTFPWKKWVLKSWIFFLRLLYAIAWIEFTATIISAVHIWFISYIINNLSWQRRPFTCWTMEENYGLLFCFWKVLLVIFFTFPVILERPRFVEIQKFCYHGNVT